MKEIKFRCWVPVKPGSIITEAYMATQGEPDLETLQSFMNHYGDEPLLMQFTGLQDKNGVDVYEGDVCQIMMRKKYGHQHEGNAIIGVVEFGTVYVNEDTLHAYDTFHIKGSSIRYRMGQELEIIGNIYEHPHLLTTP